MSFWYVSLNSSYPINTDCVLSSQYKNHYSIIELARQAEPHEIDNCKLVYAGHGHWNDKHVQSNLDRCTKRIMR